MGRPTEFGDLSPWTLERTEFFGVSKTLVCCYPVTLDGELLGYVWAGLAADDDTAGFIPRHGMGETGFDAQGTWLGRLKRARDKGMSPAEAVRQWVGAAEDPRGGGVPADAEEQVLPNSKAVQFLASRYSDQD
ncbi:MULTISPECIES: hypothetical protein [unclassified Kribbella]|uniref:hypothetical protein n=1 Tax=unclassified Kribbella TaxID=2644121 RepID=UPI003016A616